MSYEPNQEGNHSRLVLGCWKMHEKTLDQAAAVMKAALELGINYFDQADVYGEGQSEIRFGEAFKALGVPRSKIILQSKCGIRMKEGYFDFSEKHILSAVEGSLKRLGTDYLDVLLLHRPDALMEPEEVAGALVKLAVSGKVRRFGVSNFTPYQTELLQQALPFKLAYNQLQFSVVHALLLDNGFCMNTMFAGAPDRTAGVLEYCRLKNIVIQAWSPLQHGMFEGFFLNQPERFPALVRLTEAMADEKGITPAAVAIAWLLRHPVGVMPVVGTMSPDRLRALRKAEDVHLSREEWYSLYKAAGHALSYGISGDLYSVG